MRVWCCTDDCDMVNEGKAMDCPVDGTFYICLRCNTKIVVFEVEKQ